MSKKTLRDQLIDEAFLFLEKEVVPVALDVYRKFGHEKQFQKLSEEYDETYDDYFSSARWIQESTDFLFVSLQFIKFFTDLNLNELREKYADNFEPDFSLNMNIIMDSFLNKSNEIYERGLIGLIYSLCNDSGIRKRYEKDEEKNCLSFIFYLEKIVYHCSRLVKYEFKD